MALEVWYPQCWVKLYLRPEDYVPPPMIPDPSTPSDPVLDAGYLPYQHMIVPEQCSVSLRSYREGDEARIVVPYAYLPLDPRGLRSIAVHIYMGSLTPEEFARTQGPLGGRAVALRLPEIDPITGKSNEIFRGFADLMDISLGEDDTLEIRCRDVTAVFLDAPLPVGAIRGIPATTPIDKVIEAIINGDPQAQALPPDIAASQDTTTQNVVGNKMKAKRLRAQLASVNSRIAKEQALIARQPIPDPASLEQIAVLNGLMGELSAELALEAPKEAKVTQTAAWPQKIGLPGARGVVVVNETGVNPLPAIGAVKATWSDSKGTLKKGSRRGGTNEKVSYWDFITDLCVGSGFICYFRTPKESPTGVAPAVELVISTPRTYYDVDARPGPQPKSDVHLFRHGENVDTLNIKRSFAGDDVPKHIRVRAESAATGQPINVVYPPLPNTKVRSATGRGGTGQGDRVEVREWLLADSIPGNDPEALLLRIAKGLFEQLSKGEMEVSIDTTTLNARPSNRGTSNIDMLELRAADPIQIGVLAEQTPTGGNTFVTEYGRREALPDSVRIQQLIEVNGLPPFLAQQVVQADRNPKLQTVFRLRELTVEFDSENGFRFHLDAISYLDARVALAGS